MMSNKDKACFLRMALSRMEMAYDEIDRIRNQIYDTPDLADAALRLHGAIESFKAGQRATADYFGFEVKRAMPT